VISKGFQIILVLMILLLVFSAGCARKAVRSTPPEKPGESVEEAEKTEEKTAKEEVAVDYQRIELKLFDFMQVEQVPGLYNSYNPQFSTNERYLAFEVDQGTIKKIRIYTIDINKSDYTLEFEKVREVSLTDTSADRLTDNLFESFSEESFNYEFTWFPFSSSFIFTSNAGLGEYNLYAGSVQENDRVLRQIQESLHPRQYNGYFMVTEEFRKDGQARVSPDGTKIVFSSGRTGSGDLYLFDITSGTLDQLTSGMDTDLFPQWSPDGKDIVFTTGGEAAHDIHIIRDVGSPDQCEEVLVSWFFDDVLPSFSPDGRFVSFYTTYNQERDPFNTKRWGIMIVPSDGSGPSAGKELINYFHIPDVIKDNTQGTAWFPDSRHIIFAKNIDSDYNPIYIYDIQERTEEYIDTGTRINHDITVSRHGLVSFRAQQLGWDRIFIASSTYFQEYLNEKFAK